MHHPLVGEGDDFMSVGGIGSITSSNNMSITQIASSDLKDQKSKSLQNDITEIQRQMQKLSSDEELTVTEKAEEKKKLQKEKSNLSTKLKQHQDELIKSQKKEIKLAELQSERIPTKEDEKEDDKPIKETASDTADKTNLSTEDRRSLQPGTVISQNSDGTVILKEVLNQAAADEAKTQNEQTEEIKEDAAAEKEKKAADADMAADAALSEQEVQSMVSADSSMQQAERQGTLVTKTTDDIAVLKGEIKQDGYYGTDTEGKRAALNDMQKQRTREMAFQFSLLGEADLAMQSTSETNGPAGNVAQANAERTFHASGLNTSPEEQAAQQGFQVSIA